jgi:hypothetical protein
MRALATPSTQELVSSSFSFSLRSWRRMDSLRSWRRMDLNASAPVRSAMQQIDSSGRPLSTRAQAATRSWSARRRRVDGFSGLSASSSKRSALARAAT